MFQHDMRYIIRSDCWLDLFCCDSDCAVLDILSDFAGKVSEILAGLSCGSWCVLFIQFGHNLLWIEVMLLPKSDTLIFNSFGWISQLFEG